MLAYDLLTGPLQRREQMENTVFSAKEFAEVR